ncbi:MAG: DUF6029 family protein [Melioribacteraceae bacterium]|nr:DUF6029 family protein [Melioribacteraceae bacterium]MCF8353230.1 DUF6029 family protein [Melioribacteraceae bacterium]MCF8393962.1 DUF6029 family protein [Melioribacteraceae bacterium]MCF8418736.1 DUF6029 family protein [Melioribacteraceae bacterium]
MTTKSFVKLLLIFLSYSGSTMLFAQSNVVKLPDGLSISNQLEYSYDIESENEIFENWLNLDYRNGIFTAGFRFDTFQPNDPNPAVNRGKTRYAEFSYKYVKAEIGNSKEGLTITAGNFYELFGRGLILKSYEDRNVRIDNNLLGVNLKGHYAGFNITALTGAAENPNLERKDILHALDLEYTGINGTRLGISFASNDPFDENLARTSLTSLRVKQTFWNFDLYTEYGIKQNKDIIENIFKGKEAFTGAAFYGNLNFYYGSLALSGEYKYYDNYAFTSSDGTIYYNTPPSVRKDYSSVLLNRHPSILDQNNEQGFQIEALYSVNENTHIAANANITKTLSHGSYYQRIIGTNLGERDLLNDYYINLEHYWGVDYKSIITINFREELISNTKSVSPIIENQFYFDDTRSLRVVLEHQIVENYSTEEKYYDDVLLLEFFSAPKLSLSFLTEMETREPEIDKLIRKFWILFQIGYQFWDNTDIQLLFGSRQAGNICIGGVCRYEPEFRGIELKMSTRLY